MNMLLIGTEIVAALYMFMFASIVIKETWKYVKN
jgi:hypothetical protein